MKQIVENSLYSTQEEKEALLKDREKVANAFFINFLGTLGLFSISSSRGIMKNYFAEDGKVQLVNIGDANKDTSLAVKLYSEIGGLKSDTVNKIVRLLAKLKSRAITSKDFDENSIREIVSEIQYLSHRPHPILINVIKQFESGNASLKQVAKAFFQLIKTRKKDFLPVSQEFFAIAKQYLIYLKDIPEIGTIPPADVSSPATVQITTPLNPSELVSKTTKQNTSSTTIQKTVKPSPVKDEDIYLMLWKATSKAEINKLLKERGYDSFTPELMGKAIDYLLPADQKPYFDQNMAMMPSIEVFNKAFGSFLKASNESLWKALLFYNLSLSKNVEELKEKLKSIGNVIRKSNFISRTLNGKAIIDLREECLDIIFNDYRRRVINLGPSDNPKEVVETVEKDILGLFSIFNASERARKFVEISKEKQFTEKEKIKFYIAYLIKYIVPFEATKILRELAGLLNSTGIQYEAKESSGISMTIRIFNYSNLFPGSKECIDSWFGDGVNNYLKFGTVDDIYSEIAKKWKKDLTLEIEENFLEFPETESDEDIAIKIVKEINKLGLVGDDKSLLFHKYALNPRLSTILVSPKAYIISVIVQKLICKQFKEEFASGKIDFPLRIDAVVKEMFDLVESDFSQPTFGSSIDHWNAYTSMMKSLFLSDKKLQEELLRKAIDSAANIFRFLPFTNLDWGQVVRMVMSDQGNKLAKDAALQIILDPRSASHLTDDDYAILFKNLSIEKFALVCKRHGVDYLRYLTYDMIKNHVFEVINNPYTLNVDIVNSEIFKPLFDNLKEEDKTKIFDFLKSKSFISSNTSKLGIYAHASRLSQLQFLIPEEKFKEFLNSLDETKKKAIFLNAPKYLLSHMSKEIIDETLNAILNENDNPEEFTSYFIDALVNNPDNLSLEQARKFSKILYNYDKKLKPSERASYERNYYEAMKLLRKKSIEVSDQEFAALPIQDKRTLVKYFNVDRFIETAMDEIQGDNVLIKPLDKVDEERMVQILKYNNIELPRQPIIKEKDTLSEILAKKLDVTPIEDLHVNLDELSKEELERMSVEYDSFNRYAHGRLAIRFLKSFSVSLPIQEDGFKNWLKKMEDEGLDPKIMKPVFHGTGSIGASMILRYGFKIIKSNDPAVVGRMLGDGIYFSNVIDKVAQYVSDNGYGRARGTQGYIFEMEASLGKHKRDYRCAGTGTREDEKSGIISPEWAVFSPNEQLRIYKAYLVELIDKKDMKDMKKKYLGIEESSVVEIKSFKQFINEGAGDMEHCITYIFMDGTIPVSEKERVEFEKFSASRFGKNVKLDWTGSGPAVLIYNNKESRTFVVRYTKDFMKDNVELTRYLRLVGAK